MQYSELNDHFKEKIRHRVAAKLNKEAPPTLRDYVVGCIIMLADENNLQKAAQRLYEMKLQHPETAISENNALLTITQVYESFPTEVSILHDLYQMQEEQYDIMDIIAHMEMKLLED